MPARRFFRLSKADGEVGASAVGEGGGPGEAASGGIGAELTRMLFRTSRGRRGDVLSEQPMGQADAWRMVRRRALAAGIAAPIGCHTFRATGITAYLLNGGTLEHAQAMAAHESPRTTKLYDRTRERLTREEVERIRL
jgi:integrase/recombinase XerD